ncbi:hypothetical protein ACO0LG_27935 [Undibacterium sp. Ji42W]
MGTLLALVFGVVVCITVHHRSSPFITVHHRTTLGSCLRRSVGSMDFYIDGISLIGRKPSLP